VGSPLNPLAIVAFGRVSTAKLNYARILILFMKLAQVQGLGLRDFFSAGRRGVALLSGFR
jgi:hypothetical protein